MGLPCTAVVIDDYAPRRSSYVSFPVWIYWYNVTLEISSVWHIFGKTVVLIISLFETVLVLPTTPAALRRENQGYPLRNFPLTVYNLLS